VERFDLLHDRRLHLCLSHAGLLFRRRPLSGAESRHPRTEAVLIGEASFGALSVPVVRDSRLFRLDRRGGNRCQTRRPLAHHLPPGGRNRTGELVSLHIVLDSDHHRVPPPGAHRLEDLPRCGAIYPLAKHGRSRHRQRHARIGVRVRRSVDRQRDRSPREDRPGSGRSYRRSRVCCPACPDLRARRPESELITLHPGRDWGNSRAILHWPGNRWLEGGRAIYMARGRFSRNLPPASLRPGSDQDGIAASSFGLGCRCLRLGEDARRHRAAWHFREPLRLSWLFSMPGRGTKKADPIAQS